MGEPELTWRKSTRSGANGDNCVDVAAPAGRVLVRDSTDPDGPRLAVTPAEWQAFLTTLRGPR